MNDDTRNTQYATHITLYGLHYTFYAIRITHHIIFVVVQSAVGGRSSVVGCGTRTSSRQRLRNEGRTSASGDWSVSPPSAVRTIPVTNEASSDARNSAQPAISSGRP